MPNFRNPYIHTNWWPTSNIGLLRSPTTLSFGPEPPQDPWLGKENTPEYAQWVRATNHHRRSHLHHFLGLNIPGRSGRLFAAQLAGVVGAGFAGGGGLLGGGAAAGGTAAGAGTEAAAAAGAALPAGTGGFLSGAGAEIGGTGILGSIAHLFGNGGNTMAGGGSDWKNALIKFGLDFAANKFLGGRTSEERRLGQFAGAPYESPETQGFLPPELRSLFTGPMLSAGLGNIASLLRNPGGLSPNVAEAINPRLSAESQNIAEQFRGLQSNQAGAAARGNLPVSIKAALQSALDISQERAQRGARNAALTESEGLRREDIAQTYKLLDTILQFISSGRGQAIPGLSQAASLSGQRQAMNLAQIASLLSSLGMGSKTSAGGNGSAYTPGKPIYGVL